MKQGVAAAAGPGQRPAGHLRLAIYEEQTHQDRRLAEEIREAAGDLVNRISRVGSSA